LEHRRRREADIFLTLIDILVIHQPWYFYANFDSLRN
jgi:hypothetical protein